MILIAQITDTHLFADRDRQLYDIPTAESLAAVLEALRQLDPQPDILLLTGDLSQDMTPESYQHLNAALQPLAIPTYWLPGNHDDVRVMERVLNTGCISAQKSVRVGSWQILLLDSTRFGCEEGYLSPECLTWLEQQLQQEGDTTSVLIALHHPPFAMSPAWENSMLTHPEDLLAIVDRFPQIRCVLFGHIHQAFEKQRSAVYYLGTPSTCKQFGEGEQESETPTESSQPGFRLLELEDDGTWKTQVLRINYF
jgi:Icc protein